MKKNRANIWVIPVVIVVGVYLWIYGNVAAEPIAAPTVTRIQWDTAKKITAVSTSAEAPVVAVAPNGNLTVLYQQKRTGTVFDYDVHYKQSSDKGVSWSDASMYSDTPAWSSSQSDVDYDADNKAHAVWVMTDSDGNGRIIYADKTKWGSGPLTTLHTGGNAFSPKIVASGANTLDVVWSINDSHDNTHKVYHARSTDSGGSWSPPKIISSNSNIHIAPSPVLAVGNDGTTVYAAWEVITNILTDYGTIYYAERNSGTGNWSTPVPISNAAHDAHEASILLMGGNVQVAYTYRGGKSDQWVYLATCSASADCTNAASWSVGSDPISGVKVGVNSDAPWNVFSDLIEYKGDAYVHFHGTSPLLSQVNEVIWSTNSHNNWAGDDDPQALTTADRQSVFPDLATVGDDIYMVYESGTASGNHQIYFQHAGQVHTMQRYNLNISFEGHGTVDLKQDSSYVHKVCTSNCQEAFDATIPNGGGGGITVVRLSATAASGYTFGGFTGEGDACAQLYATMNQDRSCTVHFVPNVYLPIVVR